MSHYTHNELIKFTKTSYTIAKRSLPSYSGKFSNHRYTQHAPAHRAAEPDEAAAAHVSGGRWYSLLNSCLSYGRCWGSKRSRTSPRCRSSFGGCALRCSTRCCIERWDCLREGGSAWIAIDGTGHSSQYASVYYAQRSTPKRRQRKRYTRNQIAVGGERRGARSSSPTG